MTHLLIHGVQDGGCRYTVGIKSCTMCPYGEKGVSRMDKYIVEIDGENLFLDASGSKLALSVKADNGYAVFCTEIPLTPYTEPDLDAIRNEAYEKGVEDTKQHWTDVPRTCAYKLGYENGLNDAWEAVGRIYNMCSDVRHKIFKENLIQKILSIYSASEAVEKIRQYEQEKEELKKEQSVTIEDVMRQYLDTFCKGRSCSGCPLYTPDFTCGRGHHFLTTEPVSDEEVRRAYAKVLRKMKGE